MAELRRDPSHTKPPGIRIGLLDAAWPNWADLAKPTALTGRDDIEHRIEFGGTPTPEVHAVHVIAFSDDGVVLIRTATGPWETPGGRLEPGESVQVAASRELMEEAGLSLRSPVHGFAIYWFRTRGAPDWSPWKAVLIGWADADCSGLPTNPPGAVATEEVAVVSVDQAVALFRSAGRDDVAACCRVAAHLRDSR